jgi:hypothetical protein
MVRDEFDPYRSPENTQPDDFVVLAQFLQDLTRFVQDVFDNPPDALRGEWFDEMREAWSELAGQQPYSILVSRLESLRSTPTVLVDHGLTGSSLRSKMNAWRDQVRAFLARRGVQRLAKALRTGGVIMESFADVVGLGHTYKELIKGLHHLAELVIEEGP